MSLFIQRPPGINVGVNNPGTTVYIKGSEFVDGSQRIVYSEPNGPPQFEARILGIWVTSFVIDALAGQFVFNGDGEQVTV